MSDLLSATELPSVSLRFLLEDLDAILSLSMGISEEMEDVKITAEKTKISGLKRRSAIDHNSRDQIEHSDIKLSKLVNTTQNI